MSAGKASTRALESEAANVARVVFESARRSGVMVPSATHSPTPPGSAARRRGGAQTKTRDYAKRLLQLQFQHPGAVKKTAGAASAAAPAVGAVPTTAKKTSVEKRRAPPGPARVMHEAVVHAVPSLDIPERPRPKSPRRTPGIHVTSTDADRPRPKSPLPSVVIAARMKEAEHLHVDGTPPLGKAAKVGVVIPKAAPKAETSSKPTSQTAQATTPAATAAQKVVEKAKPAGFSLDAEEAAASVSQGEHAAATAAAGDASASSSLSFEYAGKHEQGPSFAEQTKAREEEARLRIKERKKDTAAATAAAQSMASVLQGQGEISIEAAELAENTTHVTADEWAAQREHEIEAQRDAEAAEAAEAEAAAQQAALEASMQEWIDSRPKPSAQPADVPFRAEIDAVGRAGTWYDTILAFRRAASTILDQSNGGSGNVGAAQPKEIAPLSNAMATCARQVGMAPIHIQDQVLRKLRAAAEEKRVSDSVTQSLRMLHFKVLQRQGHGHRVTSEFTALSAQEKAALPLRTLAGCLGNVARSEDQMSWAVALEQLDQLRTKVHDPFMLIDCRVVAGAAAKAARSGDRAQLSRAADLGRELECNIRAKLSELGKTHAAVLMRIFGVTRQFNDVRRVYTEIESRGESDELLAGLALRYSVTTQIKTMVPKMRQEGINVFADQVAIQAMLSMLGRGEFGNATEMFNSYRAAVPPSRMPRTALQVIMRLLAENPASPDLLADALTVTKLRVGDDLTPRYRERLYEALVRQERFEEVVAMEAAFNATPMGELTAKTIALRRKILASGKDGAEAATMLREAGHITPRMLSLEAEDLLNTALRATGGDPIEKLPRFARSSGDGDDVGAAIGGDQSRGTAGAAPGGLNIPGAQQSAADPSAVALPSTEKMLELGKERDWQAAQQLLQEIPHPVPASQRDAVVLLYNCALSAAVDAPAVVDEVLADMDRHNLPRNTTTHNTRLSAYARDADRWPEALEVFAGLSDSEKDASGYSVILSLLARKGQWAEAAESFATMQSTGSVVKPSPVMYGLLIQACHKHSWEATLAAFQQLHKRHGAAAIKEIVVTRTVKALEVAGKNAEVTKVLEMMKKGKGGKKK